MARLLLIVLIAAVGWYLYRRLTLGGGNASAGGSPGAPGPATPPPVMQRCAECGVHAAESAGVRYQNLFFCSPEHLDAYLGKHGRG